MPKEERVKKIVQAIINGDNLPIDIFDDDILYIRDLGIVSQSSPLEFANPIYAEIVPRIIAGPIQESFLRRFKRSKSLYGELMLFLTVLIFQAGCDTTVELLKEFQGLVICFLSRGFFIFYINIFFR